MERLENGCQKKDGGESNDKMALLQVYWLLLRDKRQGANGKEEEKFLLVWWKWSGSRNENSVGCESWRGKDRDYWGLKYPHRTVLIISFYNQQNSSGWQGGICDVHRFPFWLIYKDVLAVTMATAANLAWCPPLSFNSSLMSVHGIAVIYDREWVMWSRKSRPWIFPAKPNHLGWASELSL